jgi:competence protein ComEA
VPDEPLPAPPTWRDRIDLLTGGGQPPPPVRVALAAGGLVLLVVIGWLLLRDPAAPAEAALPRARPAATSTTTPALVVAQAAGAVVHPGLYRLPRGSRVDDLVRAAGGAVPEADLDRVNLAAPLADGIRVFVPRRGEPGAAEDASGAPGDGAGPLDLNTATEAQFDELPGVGPATAKAIVAERTRRGRFRSIQDLLDVRGIGPAKLEQLAELVCTCS